MDINYEMLDWILVWVLGIADVVLLSFVFYSIYLFRKDTYNIEKYINKNLKSNKK